ncbi:flagellar basal-body rod protein FlgB [Acidihalobacter yilgarnensis]|uniref:Flagellar basal body rod protein FlgB n=1 Tax=Acidihalobacter yilgarnensis TaxID=2819280 RepID=A0A1D8IPR2_9GAMM|nr:flagellar basal body rod protein FlgB [Acidihalobacter yilgarnensis]AOU98490.1 flagellar basal-body rod protein FlgB [Acidihalobacter yilgarnensis]
MPFSIDQALGSFPQALQLEAQRAELLASNIANADTPGYKARDIDFKAALASVSGHGGNLALVRTSPQHMEPASGSVSAPVLYQVPLQPSLDGNTVNLQYNQAAFGENALRYQATLAFLTGRITGLKNAIMGT